MKTTELERALKEAYYSRDAPYGFSTASRLYNHIKKSYPHVTLAKVRDWLKHQDVATRFKLRKKHFKRTIFTTRAPHQQWCADLLFPLSTLRKHNQNYSAILIVQDLFSRSILGLKKLKNKKSENVAIALEEIIKETGRSPFYFSTDQGLEFKGSCQKVYQKYNITHFTSHGFDTKMATVERANLYVKHRLSKIMASEKTLKWTPYLDEIRHAFNHTYSRVLGRTPHEATKLSNRAKVYQKSVMEREDRNYAKTMTQRPKFKQNDLCRISQKHNEFYKGTSGGYSESIYRVVEHQIKSGIYVYFLAEYLTGLPIRGSFLAEELQEVKGVTITQQVEEILSYRLSPENKQELLVKLRNSDKKKWIPYSELIVYDSDK